MKFYNWMLGFSCLVVALGCLADNVAGAEASGEKTKDKKAASLFSEQKPSEYTVTADSMISLLEQHRIELEGNVLVEDETSELTARKMIVYFDEENQLKQIEAMENVVLRRKNVRESASGNTAVYDAKTETITLRGNCIIVKDSNTMRCNQVIYDRNRGTLQAERVSIQLQTKGINLKKTETKK